jgi:uncharacterized membrane protein YphA (DoxX/SURF4 family)
MFTSSRYSYLVLRLGLAVVFLWFGIDKIIHPAYWLNAWVASSALYLMDKVGLTGTQFIYINGIFEILIGLSMVTGVFSKLFSFVAVLFLLMLFLFVGLNEVTIRDFGLIGGFIAVILWPEDRQRF